MNHALTALLLGLTMASTPAAAYRGARATLAVDNDLHAPVRVYVDGDFMGRIPPRGAMNLSVTPGTHGVRLVQGGVADRAYCRQTSSTFREPLP